MALTYVTYTATAAQTDFTITFPYLDTTHVKVSINGVATTSFTVDVSGTPKVVLSSGAAAGETVKVHRETPGRTADLSTLLVDFQDGSVLSEADLDKVTNQLLYLAQEAEETGASSLPLDWDGNYHAQSKRIKNLSGDVTGDNDATTKAYVDGLSLYGGSVSLPQSWAYVGSDSGWSNPSGSDWQLTLSSPIPTSDNQDLFVVALNGLTQRPTTDFTITQIGESYIIKLLGWTDKAATDIISITNFGVARTWIDQPLKGATASDVSLTVQRHTDGQSANLQEWVTEAATPVVLASVNEDGDATFVDVTATGNAAVTGTMGVTGDVAVNTNKFNVTAASGNTTVAGTMGVTGATTLSGTLAAGPTTITGATTSSDKLTVSSNGADITGNLNLLTGALQYAGVGAMTIRQIVSATAGSNRDSATSSYLTVSDLKCSVTPKTAASKFLLLANLDCYYYDTTDPGSHAQRVLGITTQLVANTTSAAGAEQTDGTNVGHEVQTRLDRVFLSTSSYIEEYRHNIHTYLYEPGSADPFTIDVCHRAESTPVDLARVRVASSTFYVIEIG